MRLRSSKLLSRGSVVLVVLLVLGLGTVGTAMGQSTNADEPKEIADVEFTIADEHVVVKGISVTGPGVPDVTIEDRTFTIDATTIEIDGLSATFDGETYEAFDVTIHVENVTVTLSDITLGDG